MTITSAEIGQWEVGRNAYITRRLLKRMVWRTQEEFLVAEQVVVTGEGGEACAEGGTNDPLVALRYE
jgi:hypothetical protein